MGAGRVWVWPQEAETGGRGRGEEMEKGNGSKVVKAKQAAQHLELISSVESEGLEQCFGQRG